MNYIPSFLQEFAPANPDTVVLKNKQYSKGLTEGQIYNYYIMNKYKILNWIDGRHVSFFLRMEDDKIVVKRNHQGRPIILTNSNYDEMITGRTNSIYVEHPDNTNYFVVDIDAGQGVPYNQIWEASKAVRHILGIMGVDHWETLFTSPYGMHVIGYLSKKSKLQSIRYEVLNLLTEKQDKYLVDIKGRHPGTINLDLSPNNKRSLHMCRYGLTKEGLICDDISIISSEAGKKIK